MIRGIEKRIIVENFKDDGNSLEYAKEYGVNEVVDGHLYHTYEGTFSDDEVDEIISLLASELGI